MNTGRVKFPSPPIGRAAGLANENIKTLSTSNAKLRSYLESQTPAGNVVGSNMLKKASKDIILDTDTISAFFDKLAEIQGQAMVPAPLKEQPVGKDQNIKSGYTQTKTTKLAGNYIGRTGSPGKIEKTIIQSPIPRMK